MSLDKSEKTTKYCPFCAETISVDALKCASCGEYLSALAQDFAALIRADSWWKRKKAEHAFWKTVKGEEWLHSSLCLARNLMNSSRYRKQHPFAEFLQTEASKDFRELVACEILGPLLAIAESENKTLACRGWIVELCGGYATLRVLFAEPRYSTEEVAGTNYHPCVSGLYDWLEDIIRLNYSEEFRRVGDMELCKQGLRAKGIQFNFYIMIATNVRDALGDTPGNRDWLNPMFNSMCALIESRYRADLKLPALGNSDEILTEQLTIERNVLEGLRDPLAGVTFARPLRDQNVATAGSE